MRTTLLTRIAGAAILGGLFWCSARACVTVLLVLWMILIGSFVYSTVKERLLYVPVLLGAIGVLGSIFVLAIPGKITLAANVAVVVSFVASVALINRGASISLVRHNGL